MKPSEYIAAAMAITNTPAERWKLIDSIPGITWQYLDPNKHKYMPRFTAQDTLLAAGWDWVGDDDALALAPIPQGEQAESLNTINRRISTFTKARELVFRNEAHVKFCKSWRSGYEDNAVVMIGSECDKTDDINDDGFVCWL